MRIARYEFDPHLESLNVYVSGCAGDKCPGCHNPELWDFDAGMEWEGVRPSLVKKLMTLGPAVKRVFIWGGEPMDQCSTSLKSLLDTVKSLVREVWLFTRNDLLDVPPDILFSVDYLKTGRFDLSTQVQNYEVGGIKLASSNQKLYKVSRGTVVPVTQ